MDDATGLARDKPRVHVWLSRLASSYLSVAFFPVLAVFSYAAAQGWAAPTGLMLVPFVLLAINMGAATAVHARFRSDPWLLMFHWALMGLMLLFVLARLTYFDGEAILTRGLWFDGHLERSSMGPLHGDHYRNLRFKNDGFIEGAPRGNYRGPVFNQVVWQMEPDLGAEFGAVIGEDRPLVIGDYRVYPTVRRGLSPLLLWVPTTGDPERGTIQLPPLPLLAATDYPQGASWTLANGEELWATVRATLEPPTRDRPNLGTADLKHVLVIRSGEGRHELRVGESVRLSGGTLTYVGLESWMGYHIIYDPTRPWLVAVVLVAVLSLVGYYVRRLAKQGGVFSP